MDKSEFQLALQATHQEQRLILAKLFGGEITADGAIHQKHKEWFDTQIATLNQKSLRDNYLKKRGLPSPSTDEEREQQKWAYVQSIDYEAAFMLFDPHKDQSDGQWLFTIGYIYNHLDKNEALFNPKRASVYNTYNAVILNHAGAQYNLGIDAIRGYEQETSIETAEFWFNMAYGEGFSHPIAYERLVGLRIAHPDYYLSIYEKNLGYSFPFDKHFDVDPQLDAATKLETVINKALHFNSDRFYWASYMLRSRIERGLKQGVEHISTDTLVSRDRYDEWLIEERGINSQDTEFENACIRSVLPYLPYADENEAEIRHYLEKVPSYDNVRNNNGVSFSLLAKRLLDHTKDFKENPSSYQQAAKFVAALVYYRSKGEEDVFEKAENFISTHRSSATPALINQLEFCEWQSVTEPEKWGHLALQAQAVSLNQTLQSLQLSALRMGPSYNEIDSKTGLPILGHFLKAAKSSQNAETEFKTKGYFTPPEGIVHLNGIKAYSDGTFSLDVISTPQGSGIPAHILPEDIDVALSLIFGLRTDLKQVYLSLEGKDSNRIENNPLQGDIIGSFKYKLWSPEWLGHTHLGRTLYITDALTGALAWSIGAFDIVAEQNTAAPNMHAYAKAFITDLVRTGGRNPEATSLRVMLRPANQIAMAMSRHANYTQIDIKDFRLFIEGNYYLDNKDGMIALDDPFFEHGRITQKLTNRFNDVAALLPVFERARQLGMLLYSLKKMRDIGWAPNLRLKTQIDRATKHYTSLPKLPVSELLQTRMPFK